MTDYDPADPTTWAHQAAAQTHVEAYTWRCLGEIVVDVRDPADPGHPLSCARGMVRRKWKSLGQDQNGNPSLDAAEVLQAEWEAARDRGNYWDLDKLCEVDLAVVGRWP